MHSPPGDTVHWPLTTSNTGDVIVAGGGDGGAGGDGPGGAGGEGAAGFAARQSATTWTIMPNASPSSSEHSRKNGSSTSLSG